MFAPRRILVPTNFSEYSDTALKKALDIAYQYKATIYLLHVIDDKFYDWTLQCGIGPDNTIKRIEDESLQEAEELLRRQMDAYVLSRKVQIVPLVKIGTPSKVILNEQKEKEIDFMVIGSPKKPGLIRKLVGSVVYKVVSSASFPALVVTC